jgi:hypothetical protein
VLRQFFGRIWQTLWQPPKSNFVDLKDDESSRFGLALRSIGRRRLFRRRAYDLSPSERTRHPMSKIDRRTEVTPSPSLEEQRILMRALGCSVEELVTRLGPENAIRRVKTELRRGRRARSQSSTRSGSAVLVMIETDTDEERNTKPARSARHMAAPDNDSLAQD